MKIEENKLIADFMGMKYGPERKFENGEWTHTVDSLSRFHSSWDWLIPVLEKIGEYKFNDEPPEHPDYAYVRTFQKHMVRINRFSLHQEETLLRSAYKAVIEFIEWYNKKTH